MVGREEGGGGRGLTKSIYSVRDRRPKSQTILSMPYHRFRLESAWPQCPDPDIFFSFSSSGSTFYGTPTPAMTSWGALAPLPVIKALLNQPDGDWPIKFRVNHCLQNSYSTVLGFTRRTWKTLFRWSGTRRQYR